MLKKVLAVAGLLVTVATMAACDVTDPKNQASANLYENAQNASEAKETIVKPAKRADAGEDELVFEDNTQVLDEFNDSGALVKRNSENKDYLAEVFSSKDMEYLGEIGENYIVFSTTIPEVNRFEYKTSPFYREGRYVYDIYELAGTYMIPVDVSWVVSFTDFGREDKTIVKLSFAEDMDAVSMDPKICGNASGDSTTDPMTVTDSAEFDTYRFHEAVTRANYGYGSDVIFDGNTVYFTSAHALSEGLEYIGVWSLSSDVQTFSSEEIFRDAKDNDTGSIDTKAECLIRETYDFNGVTQISEDFKERDYSINYYVHKLN